MEFTDDSTAVSTGSVDEGRNGACRDACTEWTSCLLDMVLIQERACEWLQEMLPQELTVIPSKHSMYVRAP